MIYCTLFQTESVPWLSIIKAPCVWACMTAHVCNNWTNYTLLTNIPTFMKEVLKFDIKSVRNKKLHAEKTSILQKLKSKRRLAAA